MLIKINVDKPTLRAYKELAEDSGEDFEDWLRAALAQGVEALSERTREVMESHRP